MPSIVNPPTGCPFHPRCIFADEKCAQLDKALERTEDGRLVACHYYRNLEEHAKAYKGESV